MKRNQLAKCEEREKKLVAALKAAMGWVPTLGQVQESEYEKLRQFRAQAKSLLRGWK